MSQLKWQGEKKKQVKDKNGKPKWTNQHPKKKHNLCVLVGFFGGIVFKTNKTGSVKIAGETNEMSQIKISSNKEFVAVEIKSDGILKSDVDMSHFDTTVAQFSPYEQAFVLHAVPKQIFLPKEIYQNCNIAYNEHRLAIASSKAYNWGVVLVLFEDSTFEVINLDLWGGRP